MAHPRRLILVPLFALVATAACEDEMQGPAYAQNQAGEYLADGEGEAQDVPVGVDGDAYSDTDPSALTDFHSTLDSHGAWVDDPTYGTVWVPSTDEVGPDFAPYVTAGSWAYEDDYVWVSEYEWGWVPFHYGRWAWCGARWGWIPGRQYAGAWVNWRTGPDGYGYVGWGPRAPAFGWRGGVAFGLGAAVVARPGPVVFVGRDELFAPRVAAHVLVGDRVGIIAGETRPYVRAEPVVSGHPVSQGALHGPLPTALGLPASAVTRVSPNDRGFARARAYAHPSTAQALGGQLPTPHVVRVHRAGGGGFRAGGGAVMHAAPMGAPRGGGGHGGGGHGGHR